MGFGYGQTTYWSDDATNSDGKRVRKTYDAQMVAHIWNAESQSFARTGNGNFAFRGDTLYSYGTRWIVAKLFNGAALINSERYSITTTGHESEATSASKNRPQFFLPSFPDSFAHSLDWFDTGGTMTIKRNRVRQLLADDSLLAIMRAERIEPGESRHGRYVDGEGYKPHEGERVTFGEWLCILNGLKPEVARNAAAKLDAARERAAKLDAARERKAFLADAARVADLSDKAFREVATVRDATEWRGEASLLELAKQYRAFRIKGDLSKTRKARLWTREKRLREIAANFRTLHAIASRRARVAMLIRYTRQTLALDAEVRDAWPSHTWAHGAGNLLELSQCAALPLASRDKLQAIAEQWGERGKAARAAEEAEREAERKRQRIAYEKRNADVAANRKAWIAGEPLPFPNVGVGRDFQRDDGTPYIRIAGDELLTSWGASVPLAHAVKVFRFVKLCRERGEGWTRNGKVVRVGHFQVDRIEPNGDFTAGCHRFVWAEVERAAMVAGVIEASASAEAVEVKESA
jgi:hypothetical protein